MGGAACALLVVGVAAGSHFSSPQAVTSSVVAPVQLNQIAVVPPREECAKIGVNCAAQKCCKVTGYECYEVKPGMAKCMKECTPGKDGTCFHHTVPMKASKKSQRWGKVALAVGAACALLVVGVAAGSHISSPQAVTSSVVAPVQLNQIAVVPP